MRDFNSNGSQYKEVEADYYKGYLKGLEDYLHKESLTMNTLQYYNIAKEIEDIKLHIVKVEGWKQKN